MLFRILILMLLTGVAMSNVHRATAEDTLQWKLTQNVLPKCELQSTASPGASLPNLTVTYTKGHSYVDYEAWTAACDLPTPLDIAHDTRFTCRFQTDAGNGWYSGRWALRLTDSKGANADYVIHKEAWRARTPVFVEQALSAFPPKFDTAHIVKVSVLGNASAHAQTATVRITALTFDARPTGEAEARRRAAWQALQAKLPATQPFFVHPLLSTAKPFRDDWEAGWTSTQPTAPVQMHVARGGRDDCQFAVLSAQDAGPVIHLHVDPLIGPGGATIAPAAVKLYEMLWVPTLPEGRPDVLEGWYPDILKPITGSVLPLHREYMSDLWVDVQAPHTAIPGIYQGRLTMTQGTTSRIVPLTLTVHNFTLPETPTFRTAFWFWPSHFAAYNGIKLEDLKLSDYKPYLDMALEHHMTPISTDYQNFTVTPKPDGTYDVDVSKFEDFYGYTLAHGGNAVNLGFSDWSGGLLYIDHPASFPGETPADAAKQTPGAISAHRQEILRTYLGKEHAFLAAHGWNKYAYLQLYDEAGGAGWQTVSCPVVKSVSPETLIAQTQMPEPAYAKYLDIPMPTIPAVDNPADPRGYGDLMRKQGKLPWYYSCVSYGITIPEVGVRDRLVPLQGFNGNADGYLFWALKWWQTPEPDFPVKPWAEYRSANGLSSTMGDGTLLYPPPVRGAMPMASTRIKTFRDGMEDYEFLHALRVLYDQKKAKLTPTQEQAVQHALSLDPMLLAAWEHPELVIRRRAEAGRWIDRLSRM